MNFIVTRPKICATKHAFVDCSISAEAYVLNRNIKQINLLLNQTDFIQISDSAVHVSEQWTAAVKKLDGVNKHNLSTSLSKLTESTNDQNYKLKLTNINEIVFFT